MKKTFISASLGLLAILVVAFGLPVRKNKISADKIFINGKILTVDANNSIAQAVAIKDGKIIAVGSTKEITALKTSATEIIDLKGKTLTPGFIDGHSHFMGLSRSKVANIAAPPVGNVRNIPDIIHELQAYKQKNKIDTGEWISAFGYDQDQLEEQRHPTKEDLDAAFPDNPVTLTHVSGHMTLANSLALKLSGIDANTPDPDGGIIVRAGNSKEPTGLLQEKAAGLLKRKQKPKPSLDEQLKELVDQQNFYASNGITTAQDGSTSFESLELLREASQQEKLFIDIEALPAYATLDKVLAKPDAYKFGILQNHLKLAGTKVVAD